MEVILVQNIEKLGTRGQVVKVADGYGRNYLLPQKMAVAATPQNRKWVEQQRAKFLKLEAGEKAEAQDLATLMQGLELVMTRRAGEKGQLFGSVTSIDIEESLAEKGFKIDRRKIQLGNPVKVLGEFDVPIKLHREVTVSVKVKVESDAPSAKSLLSEESVDSAESPENTGSPENTETTEAAPEAS